MKSITTHFAVVIAVLVGLLLGGAVVNHIHDSFEGVSTGLDKPQSGATPSTGQPATDVGASLSPDDTVFLEQARIVAPTITANSTEENMLGLGTAIREACAAGVNLDQMITDVNRKDDPTLPPVEVGRLIRLAVAVYCQPVNSGADRVSRNGERA